MRILAVTAACVLFLITGSLGLPLGKTEAIDIEPIGPFALDGEKGLGPAKPIVNAFLDDPLYIALSAAQIVPPKTIQPGARLETSVGLCTMNFVFDGLGAKAGKVFIGTAAHCVERVGDSVYEQNGLAFGKVAVFGDQNSVANDWALIEVTSYFNKLSPAVRGHPDFPTGYTRSSETAQGDLVGVSGYGLGFEVSGPSREQRISAILSDSPNTFVLAPSTAIMGDSGGPFVHLGSGKAYGMVSRGYINPVIGDDTGPTVEGMMAKMTAKGFPVTLRTA